MFSPEMKFSDWSTLSSGLASQVIGIEDRLMHLYKKWYDFSYAKSDADLATALGTSIENIAAFKLMMEAFNDSYKFWHNVAVTTRDRESDLSKFLNI